MTILILPLGKFVSTQLVYTLLRWERICGRKYKVCVKVKRDFGFSKWSVVWQVDKLEDV